MTEMIATDASNRNYPSQKITTQEDGSLLAEFDLDGTEEIKRWVMSFGRHAEVLGPEELRGGDSTGVGTDDRQLRPGPRF